MKVNSFYIIKDEFFEEMQEPYLKGNKAENRPHYYCFSDDNTGLYWVIPLSHKIEKYQAFINKRAAEGKQCDIFYIAHLDNDTDSVFTIGDMFPITKEYILREYTIAGIPFKLTRESDINEINRRAKKVLALLRKGVKFSGTQPDVLRIERILLDKAGKCHE